MSINDAVVHRASGGSGLERSDYRRQGSAFAHTLYNSIRDIDADEWAAAGASGLMMDPRFISVVEETMAEDLRVWHAIFRDGARPVACASFGLYRTDLATLATPKARTILNRIRRAVPGFGYVKVLFCGLPVSIGQKAVGFAEDCDRPEVVRAIGRIMEELARGHGARVLVAKEFTEAECELARYADRLRLLPRGNAEPLRHGQGARQLR